MELREALYFYTVAKHQNITKAAEELMVSQPSLSKYISQLESSLNIKLFNRVKNHLTLTYAGEIYTETARKMLLLNNQLDRQIQDIRDLSDGRVVVGIPASIGVFVLPKILPVFRERFPNIRVEIKESNSKELEDALLNNAVDFSIMHRISHNPLFQYEAITRDEVVLVCSKAQASQFQPVINNKSPYPSIPSDQFMDMGMIMIKQGGWLRNLIDSIYEKNNRTPNIIFETSNIFTAYLLACSGFGLSIIPESIHKFSNDPAGQIYSLDSSIDYGLVICSVKNSFLSKASEAFIATLTEEFTL